MIYKNVNEELNEQKTLKTSLKRCPDRAQIQWKWPILEWTEVCCP
jgi:hypothetical protein